MSRIRSKDTAPEKTVRSILHGMGYRFRLHVRDLPGTPDIVLPRHKIAVFVHGCFWHRHPGCKYAYTPKSRQEFWSAKFQANIERHDAVVRRLMDSGWSVLVIWECETRDREQLAVKLRAAIESLSQAEDSPNQQAA
jgi:DNA mismatch endonuclease (patch repair protein)